MGDEIIIVEEDYVTVHVLNKTAGFIWTLADGSRRVEDISSAIYARFDVIPDVARIQTEIFCNTLLDSGLISLLDVRDGTRD